MKTQLTTLPSGLRIATCEIPHAGTASVGIWASVGGRHEPEALNGISHFIEHMLFKGTAKRSARRIMQEIEGVGGDMNAYTAEERTCYYATTAAEYLPRLCDVLCDLYVNPRFAPRDIERERAVIGEEILMYRDEPSSHVQELLNQSCWPKHSLGRPLTGTVETIRNMGALEFGNYRTTHYHAASTVVTAAGRVTHEDVVTRVSKLLKDLPRGRKPTTKPAPPLPTSRRLKIEARDTQQTQVALALPGCGNHDPQRYAFHLLHILLGGNASSRLFQEVREKRGLCYSVATHPSSFDDVGVLNVSLGLERKNLEKSLRLILAEFENMKNTPCGPAELRRAKEYAIGASRMALERASNQSSRIGQSLLVYGRIRNTDEIHDRLRAVTAEEVRTLARKILNPSKIVCAVIGPTPDERLLGKILGL